MGNGTSCRSIRTVIKLEIKHFVIWLIARILLLFIVGYICNRMSSLTSLKEPNRVLSTDQ